MNRQERFLKERYGIFKKIYVGNEISTCRYTTKLLNKLELFTRFPEYFSE